MKWPPLAWVALCLLAALVVTNMALLILLGTDGPLIGVAFYAALSTLLWRGRDYRAAAVGGLMGLAVHGVEVVTVGWSGYPALMALNLILPAMLALVAWSVNQGAQQAHGEN